MSRDLTVSRTGYPPVASLANRALGLAERVRLAPDHVDLDSILDDARRRTGLTDWGDEGFLEGAFRVVNDPGAARFTPLARVVIREVWTKAVVQRLRLQELLKAHPEIHDIEIERPIFVLGFPRTGTTVLQHLLSLHGGRRGLPFWELLTPIPAHSDAAIDRRRRVRIARNTLRPSYLVAPEMSEIHAIQAETLEECWYLFCHTFTVLNWDVMTGLHDYGRWLLGHDMRPAYQEYKTWLKVLVWRNPARQLLLKCPEHLWFVDALLDTFPDAGIVWTHRDPVSSIASYSSLMSLTRRLMYGTFVHEELGPYVTERFTEGMTRAMAARDRWGNERNFFDAPFPRTVAEPVAVLRDILEHFELPIPDDLDARAEAWLEQDRSDKRGAHHYSPEAFGVDASVVREQLSGYAARCGIEIGSEGT